MLDRKLKYQFTLALFAATSAWYIAAIVTYILEKYHTPVHPTIWYPLYWPSFYDGFLQHTFYLLFFIQILGFGFLVKYIRPASQNTINLILLESIFSILLIPLAATGIYGIAIGEDWPSRTPPIHIYKGILWCLPGLLALCHVTYQLIYPGREE